MTVRAQQTPVDRAPKLATQLGVTFLSSPTGNFRARAGDNFLYRHEGRSSTLGTINHVGRAPEPNGERKTELETDRYEQQGAEIAA